jgi:putative peptide zinc metalloprotease protein
MADDLRPGLWLPPKTPLLSLVDTAASEIEAYVFEADLPRIAVGDAAVFYPEDGSDASFAARVGAIDRANTRQLPAGYLASRFGGAIPVREPHPGELVPERAVYRVLLVPDPALAAPARVTRGRLIINGRAESLARRLWRSMLSVVVRESGA